MTVERTGKIKALVQRLFGLKERTTKPQRLMAAAVAEATLRDLVAQYHKAAAKVGHGVLVVRLAADGETTQWANVDTLRSNLALAEEFGDTRMIELHRTLLTRLEAIGDDKHKAILMIVEDHGKSSTVKVYVLNDEEMPEQLRELLSSWGR